MTCSHMSHQFRRRRHKAGLQEEGGDEGGDEGEGEIAKDKILDNEYYYDRVVLIIIAIVRQTKAN